MPAMQAWSEVELARLAQMVSQELPRTQIGDLLGRSEKAVRTAITRHGIPIPQMRRAPNRVPVPPRVFRDPCPGCGVRLDADPAQCCPRGRALRRLVA